MTVREVLNQRLDPLLFLQSDPMAQAYTRPSRHKSANHSYPPKLLYWQDFKIRAQNFVQRDIITLNNPIWPRNDNVMLPAYSEEQVRQRVLIEMALPLNQCGLGDIFVGEIGIRQLDGIENELSARGFKYLGCKPDLFFGDREGVFAVGEAKTKISVEKLSENANSVVQIYTRILQKEIAECGYESMTYAIAQLHGYMVKQHCRYGLVTTYDMTWFFKIVSADNNSYAMQISDGVPASYFSSSQPQPSSSSTSSSSSSNSSSTASPGGTCTLLRCWHYFIYLAQSDLETVPGFPPKHHILSIGKEDTEDLSSEGEEKEDKDDSNFDPPTGGNSKRKKEDKDDSNFDPPTGGNSKRKKSPQLNTEEKKRGDAGGGDKSNKDVQGMAHRTSLILKSLSREICFDAKRSVLISCGSRCGEVYRYRLRGTNISVAVKSFCKGLEEFAVALRAELKNYDAMKALQGIAIPRMFGTIAFRDPWYEGIVMDLLDPLPDDFQEWSPEQRRSGKKALYALLDQFDARQIDLRGANFGVDPATGQVLALDLEDIIYGESGTGYTRNRYKQKVRHYMN